MKRIFQTVSIELACAYCRGTFQSRILRKGPAPCPSCGTALTGPVDEMSLRYLARVVFANGYRIDVSFVPNATALAAKEEE